MLYEIQYKTTMDNKRVDISPLVLIDATSKKQAIDIWRDKIIARQSQKNELSWDEEDQADAQCAIYDPQTFQIEKVWDGGKAVYLYELISCDEAKRGYLQFLDMSRKLPSINLEFVPEAEQFCAEMHLHGWTILHDYNKFTASKAQGKTILTVKYYNYTGDIEVASTKTHNSAMFDSYQAYKFFMKKKECFQTNYRYMRNDRDDNHNVVFHGTTGYTRMINNEHCTEAHFAHDNMRSVYYILRQDDDLFGGTYERAVREDVLLSGLSDSGSLDDSGSYDSTNINLNGRCISWHSFV